MSGKEFEIIVTWDCSEHGHKNSMTMTTECSEEDIEEMIETIVSDPSIQRENPCSDGNCKSVGFCETEWTYQKIDKHSSKK